MEYINAIGRRKSSVARVYMSEGTGKITINKKDLEVYFPSAILQYVVKQPLNLLEVAEKYDIKVNLDGGGFTGQSQALRLAIARALVKVNEEDKKKLKDAGFLTRDAREVYTSYFFSSNLRSLWSYRTCGWSSCSGMLCPDDRLCSYFF